MSLARDIEKAYLTLDSLQNKLHIEVFRILGFEGEWWWDSDVPFKDISFDWYDSSIELIDCANDLKLNKSQRREIWSLGFDKCWLKYRNGTQRYYRK